MRKTVITNEATYVLNRIRAAEGWMGMDQHDRALAHLKAAKDQIEKAIEAIEQDRAVVA